MRIKNLREQLEYEGEQLYPNLQLLKNWKYELTYEYREEEAYWKLWSNENWLCSGDQNMKYSMEVCREEGDKTRSVLSS